MTVTQPDYTPTDKRSARQAARHELQRQEALLKTGALQGAILNSAAFSVIATDELGIIQLFNVGAERMLGYAASEMVNRLTPTHISDPFEVMARAVELSRELGSTISPGFDALVFKAGRGIEDSYELTYIRKDGSRLPVIVSVSALTDGAGATIGYLLVGTDNSARKQAEERLQWTEVGLGLMLDSVTDHAIVRLDPQGLVLSWNAGAQRIQGYDASEIIGRHFGQFWRDQDTQAGAAQPVLDSAAESGQFEQQGWQLRKDGSTFWAKVAITPIRDPAGGLRGYALLSRDLTQSRIVEAELTGARQLAERSNLVQADFLGSMSHELRTPLTAILGFAQLMASSSPAPSPAQGESIAQILRAGWFLRELNDEVLDLATIESGRSSWSLEAVALDEVLRGCRTLVEPQALAGAVRVDYAHPDAPVFVKAEPARLTQALAQLVATAVRCSPGGASVGVENSAGDGQRVRISVRAAGPGLSEQQLTQLFQPFSRVLVQADAAEGTGIGLAMTRRVVEVMGGAVGVQSTAGAGSVFWIELPRADAPAQSAGPDAVASTGAPLVAAGPVRTVLYVEDNTANLQLVEQIIARRPDLRLISAGDGALGLELARTAQPDLVLMDISLPGMSGITAMQLLRADPATAHIPVVALSANAIPRDIGRGLEAGFFRYITKPIRIDEFLQTLDLALEFAQAAALSAPSHGPNRRGGVA